MEVATSFSNMPSIERLHSRPRANLDTSYRSPPQNPLIRKFKIIDSAMSRTPLWRVEQQPNDLAHLLSQVKGEIIATARRVQILPGKSICTFSIEQDYTQIQDQVKGIWPEVRLLNNETKLRQNY
jgi:hypothetical protein